MIILIILIIITIPEVLEIKRTGGPGDGWSGERREFIDIPVLQSDV